MGAFAIKNTHFTLAHATDLVKYVVLMNASHNVFI